MAQLGMMSSMASLLTWWSLGWGCCPEIGEAWQGVFLSFGFLTAWWYPSSGTAYVMAAFPQNECSKKPRRKLQSCFWQSLSSHVTSFLPHSIGYSWVQISRRGDDTESDYWEAQFIGGPSLDNSCPSCLQNLLNRQIFTLKTVLFSNKYLWATHNVWAP